MNVARDAKYVPSTDRKQNELPISGPVYRGVAAKNAYSPAAQKVRTPTVLLH